MSEGTKESHFEDDVVKYLSRDIIPNFKEYEVKNTSVYDKDLCLIPEDVIDFIKETQHYIFLVDMVTAQPLVIMLPIQM